MKDLRQKLLATFQIEHRDHVGRIREILTALEQPGVPPAGQDLDEAFRRAHSLKGAARAVDLRPIEQIAHRLETLMSRVREGALALDPPIVRVIQQALDASEDWLGAFGGATEPPAPVEAIGAIEAVLGIAGPAPAPAAAPAAAPPATPPATPGGAPAPAADTVRLDARNLDRLVSSAGQLLTETRRQQAITERLRQAGEHLAAAGAERDRVRRAASRVFQRLEASPELSVAARYVNYLDHQVQLLTRELNATRRLHERNTWSLRSIAAEIQRDVRQARMMPAETVFEGFRKMIRDLARDVGKAVDVHVSGLQVEADRLVLQSLKDPVMHILRNAVSHGLETAADRARAGKRGEGRIDLTLETRGAELRVTVDDDGRGIDVGKVADAAVRKGLISAADVRQRSADELVRLLLLAGFSTADGVTELSGRGMGLSVVSEAVARLQGSVDIGTSPLGGARVALSVPLSVSSHRLLLVSCQGQTFAVPLHGIERLLRVPLRDVQTIESKPVVQVNGQPLPLVSLAHLLQIGEAGVHTSGQVLCVILMRAGGRRVAIAVDAFLSERDAIIKELPAPAAANRLVAGGVLLEDGSVCLVLSPPDLLDTSRQSPAAFAVAPPTSAADAPARSRTILVVDDSMTTRTLEKSVLEAHGYDVAIAVDGMEALAYLRREQVGLVVSDVQMPRLDGFGLLEEMKRDPRLARVPVIIVSSLENPEEQARGLALGADAYIVKRRFEQQELLETIRQIL